MKLEKMCIIAMIGVTILSLNVSADPSIYLIDYPKQTYTAGQTIPFIVEIHNGGRAYDGYLRMQLKYPNGKTETNSGQSFTIPGTGVQGQSSIQQKIDFPISSQTPSGNYEFCIDLMSWASKQSISQRCITFNVAGTVSSTDQQGTQQETAPWIYLIDYPKQTYTAGQTIPFIVEIHNGGRAYDSYLRMQLKYPNGKTKTNSGQSFTISGTGVQGQSSIQQKIDFPISSQTPSGNYEFCIDLMSWASKQSISQRCVTFNVVGSASPSVTPAQACVAQGKIYKNGQCVMIDQLIPQTACQNMEALIKTDGAACQMVFPVLIQIF